MKNSKLKKKTIVILIVFLGMFPFTNKIYSTGEVLIDHLQELTTDIQVADTSLGWNLILINRENTIPKDYKFPLTELSNGKKVDSRIYPDLQKMMNATRADGIHLFVAEGYRTSEEQQKLLDDKIDAYTYEGYSYTKARKLAKKWVIIPG